MRLSLIRTGLHDFRNRFLATVRVLAKLEEEKILIPLPCKWFLYPKTYNNVPCLLDR